MFRRKFFSILGLAALVGPLSAEPLSKKSDVDFFRDVPSRNLKGLATRSDGRLVAGPVLTEFTSPPPADLFWCLEPTTDAAKFLLGTGPDGRVFEVTVDTAKATYTTREIAKLEDPQVFALKRLPDGAILAGTSPKGALYLIRDDKPVARVALPVDSIFDLLVLDSNTVLVATGNPGRIYKVDLKKFATVGIVADKITDRKILADRGITLFGEIRDRNVRRIAALADGRIAAGSAPRGNIYVFPKEPPAIAAATPATSTPPATTQPTKKSGAASTNSAAPGATTTESEPPKLAPVILQENRDAEVTDLFPQPNGDLYATIVFAASSGESRITPPPSATKGGGRENQKDDTPPPAQVERFGGRSALVLFPASGFPETLASRSSMAFYRMARHGEMLLLAGGEQGELVGYDRQARLSVTFAGSMSAQLNGLVPLRDAGKFLVLRNNAPGLALIDFNAAGAREAETRRLDLGTLSQIGALRFNRLRNVSDANLTLEIRTSNGSDEVEGWTDWTLLKPSSDGGWRADHLRGRYAKLRLRVTGAPTTSATSQLTTLEIDRAALFALPQNRRPQLQDFRVLTPGFGVLPAGETPPSPVVSLNQLMAAGKEEERGRRNNFMSSQVVPAPGTQVVLWTVTDPDGDNFACTFSIRREGDNTWTEVSAATRDSYAQFDTKHLPDGIYFTRLVATETAPRPAGERLTQTFETDDLLVDHTAPEMLEASARRSNDVITVTVRGRDKLALLDGIEVVFNNGVRETVEQPADGVRDGREETFTLEVPAARVSNATSVEITLYDAAGNGTAKRLNW